LSGSTPRAALVTISSSKAAAGAPAGAGADESGSRLRALAERLGLDVAGADLIADERAAIEARLRHWSDRERCALILTSGGTGVAPSDVTPEATRAVIEREVPGIPLALLDAARAHTRHWMLSRAVAGIRGRTLIVNLPGAPQSIDQSAAALEGALPHALALLAGERPRHG
jgi:molybdopterin adenylyltransferase